MLFAFSHDLSRYGKLCALRRCTILFIFVTNVGEGLFFLASFLRRLARGPHELEGPGSLNLNEMSLLDAASKFVLFSVSGLKDEKLIKKQTYMKFETCKLYSKVFRRFSQIRSESIVIKIRAVPFQSCCVFLRDSVLYNVC